jgi:hypothetical protein
MAQDEPEDIVDSRISPAESGVGRKEFDHHGYEKKQQSSLAAVGRLGGKAAALVRLLP